VDLSAVKEAPPGQLARGAAAATRNAQSLAADAGLLSGAGRLGPASSLAGLAIEEVGKAAALATLAVMPENLKARAPVGRMLEWHQMKLVTGQLVAAVVFDAPPTMLNRLAAMSSGQVADILGDAQAFALDADRLKQRGLYVDVDQTGQIREPSQITVAQVREQLERAQRAASAADGLLDRGMPAEMAAPHAIAVEFSGALVCAIAEAGHARTPEAAAGVLLKAVGKLHG